MYCCRRTAHPPYGAPRILLTLTMVSLPPVYVTRPFREVSLPRLFVSACLSRLFHFSRLIAFQISDALPLDRLYRKYECHESSAVSVFSRLVRRSSSILPILGSVALLITIAYGFLTASKLLFFSCVFLACARYRRSRLVFHPECFQRLLLSQKLSTPTKACH